MIISLYEEYLDWYGLCECYVVDKFKFGDVVCMLLVNG